MAELIPPQDTGPAIRFFREQARLTQNELADGVGVSSTTVSNWERAESGISTKNCERFCEFVGIDWETFIDKCVEYREERLDESGTRTIHKTAEEIATDSRIARKRVADCRQTLAEVQGELGRMAKELDEIDGKLLPYKSRRREHQPH